MVLQHKENFVSWDNITTEVFAGSDKWVNDSDPAFWDTAGGSDTVAVKTSTLPSVFVGSNELILYGRLKASSTSNGSLASFYAYDGVRYIGAGLHRTNTGTFWGLRSFDSATNPVSGGTTFDDSSPINFWQQGEWTWLKIVISGTSLTIFYNNDNVTIKPSEWTEVPEIAETITQMVTVTEIGACVGGVALDCLVDDIEIVSGDGIPVNNAVIDGSTVKIASTYTRNTFGQPGAMCRVVYHDPTYSLAQTVETAHRTVITASETKFNTRLFQGEIIQTDTQTKEIIANGIQKKIERKVAAYDPVYTSGFVEYLDGNTLYKAANGEDVAPVFSSFGTLTDKLIVFTKPEFKKYSCFPSAISITTSDGSTPLVPDSETGDKTNLFNIIDRSNADNVKGWNIEHNAQFYGILQFDALIKDTTVVDSTKITVSMRQRWNNKPINDGPESHFVMWNDTTNGWVSFNKQAAFDDTAGGKDGASDFGQRQSPLIQVTWDLEADLSGVATDYYSLSAANTYGWKTAVFKFAMISGDTSLDEDPLIQIEFANIELDFDINQTQVVAVAKIQTVNDHNLVFYNAAATAWLDEEIRDDGVSSGDAYYITDKISDIATALWAASGIDSILNLNFAVTDEIPDIEDLTRVMILDWIQKVSELLGAGYFIDYTTDPVNDLPTFNVVTSYTDSGLILSDADFIEPMRQTTYKIDSGDEMSTLKIIGAEGLIGTESITVEHTPDLGLESVLITRPDVHTQRQMANWLTNKKKIFTNAYRFFTCRINYDRALQDYSILGVGKEVQVKNPTDASIVDHLTGTDGRLLIYQMELNRNWKGGYSNIVTLLLQLRF